MDDATQAAFDAAVNEAFSPDAWTKVERAAPDPGTWVSGVPGRRFMIAHHVLTPVLGTTCQIQVAGADVAVPNFVLPAWYVPGSAGPWDAGGKLSGPQSVTPDGYYVANDEGRVHEVWSHPSGRAAFTTAAADEHHPTAQAVSMIEAAAKGIPWREHHAARFAPPPPAPEPEAPASAATSSPATPPADS